MSRLLVTGCTGYVAGFLAAALRERVPGATLIGTSRAVLAAPPAGFDDHRPADLGDADSIRGLIERLQPDGVFHLASARRVDLRDAAEGSSPRDRDRAELTRVNVAGTAALLEAVRASRGPGVRVLVVGSSAELGRLSPSELPAAEGAPCRPLGEYGVSKVAQAQVAEAAYREHGQDVVRVRLFNLLGPGLPGTLLPGRCVERLAEIHAGRAAPPLTFGDLDTERDYTDVRDLARGIAASFARAAPGTLHHLGSGRAVSGRRVVEALLAEARPALGPLTYESRPSADAGVRTLIADASRARDELGWTTEIAFERSIADMWRAALDQRGRAAGRDA